MILAEQLNWDVTGILAWMLFGGWFLTVESLEYQDQRKKYPGYRHTTKGRRRSSYLQMAWGFWLFVIAVFLLWKGNI